MHDEAMNSFKKILFQRIIIFSLEVEMTKIKDTFFVLKTKHVNLAIVSMNRLKISLECNIEFMNILVNCTKKFYL